MPTKPNRLSRLWQELKRRRVVHVITVYASAAFVLIELVNNLTEPLSLPPGLATVVIIVLAAGFPVAIILSWIYDLTGEGFERTRPIGEVGQEREAKVPNAWKIATYISFVVIIGLVTLNITGNGSKLRAGDIKSLVILPFENFTGDDQLDNMVAGMHSLLIGDVGRISGLRVIGKTSSTMYKDASKSATEIAKELKVDGIVEATVTCLGEDVCMQFRLIKASGKEEQVWVGDYTEDKTEMIKLYNRITQQIAEEVKVELTPEENRLLNRSRTIDKEAMDDYLRSYAHWDDLGEDGVRKAIEYLNKAAQKEPDWAPVYVGLGQLWGVCAQFGYEPPEVAIPKVFEYLDKAEALDSDYVDIHFNKAIFGTWLEWDWAKGEREFKKALAINPSDALSRIYYAHLLISLQRKDEAIMQGKIATELDPLNPLIQALYGVVIMGKDNWEAAKQQFEKALALDPNHFFSLQLMDIVTLHLGDEEGVFDNYERFLPFPETFFDSVMTVYHTFGFIPAYESVLREIEQSGYGVPLDLSMRYNLIHRYETAMEWLELGYEVHDPNMPYIGTGLCAFDSLYHDPRFVAIMDKLALPMPAE
jgi:TolB-like protein